MLLLTQPKHQNILDFIAAQRNEKFSYPEIGATRELAPKNYTIDHNRQRLGHGQAAFVRARDAVRNWKMFAVPGLKLCWTDTPIETGATVALLASHYGLWSLNACRIVYVIEETGEIQRYGFAYGTLPEHGVIGEERFLVVCPGPGVRSSRTIISPTSPRPPQKLGRFAIRHDHIRNELAVKSIAGSVVL
jgi:uncharacterized protein (UPF0548 family)